MSYEFYKIIHVCSIFIVLSVLSAAFLGNINAKWTKVVHGIAATLLFVSGMGLLARIGVSHGGPYPMWVFVKLIVWALLGILAPILAKKLFKMRAFTFNCFLVSAFVAVYYVIHKIN